MDWVVEDRAFDNVTMKEFERLGEGLFLRRKRKKILEDELKKIREEENIIKKKILSFMDAYKKKTYEFGGLGKIIRSERLSWRVPKDNVSRHHFFSYLKSRGVFDELITVNSNTMNAFCKQEIEAKKEEGDFDFVIPGVGEYTRTEDIRIKEEK